MGNTLSKPLSIETPRASRPAPTVRTTPLVEIEPSIRPGADGRGVGHVNPRVSRMVPDVNPAGLIASTAPRQPASGAALNELAAQGYRLSCMPTDVSALKAICVKAQLANYVYARRLDELPDGWSPSTDLSERVCAALQVPSQDHVRNAYGTIADPQTGLTASVLVNTASREVVLAFGGTFSGAVAGRGRTLMVGNFGTAKIQWEANVRAVLGDCPRSYAQAASLTQALSDILQGSDYSLQLVGHSLGAGVATYAALSQPTPLRAQVFGTAHLSLGLIARLPEDNVRQAPLLVQSYSVSTDPIPNLRRLPFIGIHGLGTEHFYPPHLQTGISPLNVHINYLDHLIAYMNQGAAAAATQAANS